MEAEKRRRQPPRKVERPKDGKKQHQRTDWWTLRHVPGLRRVRLGKDVTQKELARDADMSVAAISYLEWGDRPARMTSIRKLADALDVDPLELMVGEEGEGSER